MRTDCTIDGRQVICKHAVTDAMRLTAMRKLGASWPRGQLLPYYPPRVSIEKREQANTLFDAMQDSFIDNHVNKAQS